MMGSFATCCLLLPDVIVSPYDSFGGEEFPAVRPTLVVLLRYLAAFALFDALAVLLGCAIRGAGDTRFSLYVLTLMGWGVMVTPLVALSSLGELTLSRCWTALTVAIAAQGLTFLWRFTSGRWKDKTLVESDVD